jgi:membrane protease subunit (stomatin/prohibitin family)
MLVKEGQYIGPFRAGRHTLDTNNYPVLTKLLRIPFGERSPFTAEVWFVNRAIPLDVKWGTQDPIQLQDPKFSVMLPVRAFGQYAVQIDDTRKFLQKIVGTMPSFQRAQVNSYFRGLILTHAKTVISQYIVRDKTSILEISAHLNQISDVLREQMLPMLEEFGLKLVNFFVNSINTPEDDPAVRQLKAALAKRAEMSILGYTYQQERSFDMLQTAAGNEGSTQSSLMGAGMGLGLGLGVGNAIAPAMTQVGTALQPGPAGTRCTKCDTVNQPAAKFCAGCATPLAQPAKETVCSACSATTLKPSKFCSNCGRPFSCCPKCGADNPSGASVCKTCTEPLPSKCGKCGSLVPSAARFCPDCGQPTANQCAKCGTAVTPGVKFCANCGHPVNGA